MDIPYLLTLIAIPALSCLVVLAWFMLTEPRRP
jgi:hypothetical protein